MPNPERIEVFPLPNTSHAKLTRGLSSRVALLSENVDLPIRVELVTGSLVGTPFASRTY